ncbi:hypothetical protein N5C46_10535 [Rossellomorea vietnamensis]|uniref:Uncharacterized protein n=1 Tax=Rossellomorea vietnamensis TaxID=218284 RepID=A0ACD4CG61_9BACI|nr:hypothetical protein [Rossellomorea vietnamensis]UXH46452.1 hypothetical protein N5C46_10535 [Rossellomorea vietnamensis]
MGKKKKAMYSNELMDLIKAQGGININQVVNVHCNDSAKKKKCECSGVINAARFQASICPDCVNKDSFVTFDFETFEFSSSSVNSPVCVEENDVKYLTVVGTGRITTPGSSDVEGGFTLIMEEAVSYFSFLGITPSGEVQLIYFAGYGGNTTITPCPDSDSSCKKHDSVSAKLPTLQDSVEPSAKEPHAKKMIIRSDGRVEEEDLSHLFHTSI